GPQGRRRAAQHISAGQQAALEIASVNSPRMKRSAAPKSVIEKQLSSWTRSYPPYTSAIVASPLCGIGGRIWCPDLWAPEMARVYTLGDGREGNRQQKSTGPQTMHYQTGE